MIKICSVDINKESGIFLDTFLCPYTSQNTQSKIEF